MILIHEQAYLYVVISQKIGQANRYKNMVDIFFTRCLECKQLVNNEEDKLNQLNQKWSKLKLINETYAIKFTIQVGLTAKKRISISCSSNMCCQYLMLLLT